MEYFSQFTPKIGHWVEVGHLAGKSKLQAAASN